NQLRGRAGRQGDPGFSRFYVSLDDDLMKIFAKDSTRALLARAGMDSPEPLEAKMVSKAIERAQKSVEERNYMIRKQLLEYDDVINDQRSFIYEKRDEIIADGHFYDRMKSCLQELAEDVAAKGNMGYVLSLLSKEEIEKADLPKSDDSSEEKVGKIMAIFESNVNRKRELISEVELCKLAKSIYLRLIDASWQEHLEELAALRESVGLRGYAQKNPLTEYKVEGGEIFDRLLTGVRLRFADFILKIQIRIGTTDQSKLRGYMAAR
ncbi:MAG TPA: preprotein translocase subunit SecA, partial [Spirochaetaceae bacterium]|nr:preprotein translocase subunit SecA [Spirochaetaceae bacterium]